MIAALSRGDIANYVDAVFLVYIVLIFVRIVLSWVQQFRPLPYNTTLRAVTGFIEDTVDPYLNVFRRVIPPLGPLDISPILALFLLYAARGIVVDLILG